MKRRHSPDDDGEREEAGSSQRLENGREETLALAEERRVERELWTRLLDRGRTLSPSSSTTSPFATPPSPPRPPPRPLWPGMLTQEWVTPEREIIDQDISGDSPDELEHLFSQPSTVDPMDVDPTTPPPRREEPIPGPSSLRRVLRPLGSPIDLTQPSPEPEPSGAVKDEPAGEVTILSFSSGAAGPSNRPKPKTSTIPKPIPRSPTKPSSSPTKTKPHKTEGSSKPPAPPPKAANLLSEYTCPICFSPPTNATVTPCGHVMCGSCLFTGVKSALKRARELHVFDVETNSPRCPICRTVIKDWDGKGRGVIGLKVLTTSCID